jgi:hypothetical protein
MCIMIYMSSSTKHTILSVIFSVGINIGIISVISTTYLLNKPEEEVKGVYVEETSKSNIQNTEVEEDKKIYPIDVCCNNICFHIFEDEIPSLTDDTELSKYLNTNIYPYFQKYFGGKETISNSNGTFEYWVFNNIPDFSNLKENLKKEISSSINGIQTNMIEVLLKDLPGTDGTYTDKYMEVDNSKQKLYVWMNGKVVKTILLSGPVYGFQVYGVFPIIDKGISPIAPGGKYMPYWMAFYYSKSQDSWYGLHALIWWYDGLGNRVYETENNIGTRQSAGCIRMLLDDAKYLYENFSIGDVVLIHE